MNSLAFAPAAALLVFAPLAAAQQTIAAPEPAAPEAPAVAPAPPQSAPSRPLSVLTDGYFVPPVSVPGGAMKETDKAAQDSPADARIPEAPVIYED